MSVILKIGSTDLSGFVEQENVQIRTSPVYGASFTNVLGETVRHCLGVRVDLSASFNVSEENTAKSIVGSCNSDTVSVEYLDPYSTVTVFERPTVSRVPVFEDGDGVSYWNISVSMTCPLKRGDGL